MIRGLSHSTSDRSAVLIFHSVFSMPAFGRNHPLSIMRHGGFLDLCREMDLLHARNIRIAPIADRNTLERFHDADYLDAFERSVQARSVDAADRARYNLGTMECPLFEGLWERARAAVGGSILAAELALQGYLPFHPGGGTHHGKPDRASGFCYLNDPVFAILRLLDSGKERVLYVDLDAHHGDGVEFAFAANEKVHLLSFHEEGRWPGTGQLGEARSSRIINVPVPREINDDEYLFIFREIYQRRLIGLEPDAVVITVGADALIGDPLSSMKVSNSALTKVVQECVSLSRCALVLGGGGYNPWTTARMWTYLWSRLNGIGIPRPLPPQAGAVLSSLSCDLCDEDEFDPQWLLAIEDYENRGSIRPECRARVEAAIGEGSFAYDDIAGIVLSQTR